MLEIYHIQVGQGKLTEGKEPRNQRHMCSHTQESHKNTKLKAIVHM